MVGKRLPEKNNALMFIPQRRDSQSWELDSDGLVELLLPRKSLLDKLIRLFKKTPDIMRIQLDDHGSFIWNIIDGRRNIQEIGRLLEAEFGDKISPLYGRLTLYLRILKNNKFITIIKP